MAAALVRYYDVSPLKFYLSSCYNIEWYASICAQLKPICNGGISTWEYGFLRNWRQEAKRQPCLKKSINLSPTTHSMLTGREHNGPDVTNAISLG